MWGGAPDLGANQGSVPFTFEVELVKHQGVRLGIDVVVMNTMRGGCLVVERVAEDGAVGAWNRRKPAMFRLRSGDCIVVVNGVEGDVPAVAKQLCESQEVRITVQRWGPPEGGAGNTGPNAGGGPPVGAAVGNLGQHGQSQNQHGGYAPMTGPAGPPPATALSASHAAGTNEGNSGNNSLLAGRSAPSGLFGGAPGLTAQRGGKGGAPGPPPGMGGGSHEQAQRGGKGGVPGPPPGIAGGGGSHTTPMTNNASSSVGSAATLGSSATIPGSPVSVEGGGQLAFEVTLQKPEAAKVSLGIDVMPVTVAAVGGLAVKRVSKGGLVDAWNRSISEAQQQQFVIMAGDCIVRVNQVMADFAQMMQEMCVAKDLRITILRKLGSVPDASGPTSQNQTLAIANDPSSGPGSHGQAHGQNVGQPHPGQNVQNVGAPHLQSNLQGNSSHAGAAHGQHRPGVVPSRMQGGAPGLEAQDRNAPGVGAGLAAAAAAAANAGANAGLGAAGPNAAAGAKPAGAGPTGGPIGGPPIGRQGNLGNTLGGMPPPRGLQNSQNQGPIPAGAPGLGAPAGVPAGSAIAPITNTSASNVGAAGLPSPDGRSFLSFDAELVKPPSASLGIDVTFAPALGLVVERVQEGGVMDLWNKNSRDPYRVRAGDLVVEVNGVCGPQSLVAMAHECVRDVPEVSLTIQRRPEGLALLRSRAQMGAHQQASQPAQVALQQHAAAQQNAVAATASGNTPGPGTAPAAPPMVSPAGPAGPPGVPSPHGATPAPGAARRLEASRQREKAQSFVLDGPAVVRGRNACAPVAPIGAGRNGPANGAAPASTGAEKEGQGEDDDQEIGPIDAGQAEPEAQLETSSSPPEAAPSMSPEALLHHTLQLDDEELQKLFKAAVNQRPWLCKPLSEALAAQPSSPK